MTASGWSQWYNAFTMPVGWAMWMVPILMILTKKWVFAPWIESGLMLIAWCQRGFQCWDEVGRKLREGN